MKLELRMPISPTPAFYSQVRLIAMSLAALGGDYARARIQVSIGESPDPAAVLAANRWSSTYPVEWYVVPADVQARTPGPHWVSGHGRYALPSDADVVVLCDSDICPVAPFDELLDRLGGAAPTVAGLQAHYSPFPGGAGVSEPKWRGLLQAIGQADAPMPHLFSLDVPRKHGHAPAYFNYGFVAFNAAAFRAIAADIDDCLAIGCRELPENAFAAQVALSLAILRTGVAVEMLGHEHNCANDDQLLKHRRVRPDDVRVIHYLRGDHLDRHRFLADRALFEAFVAAPQPNAINERLRRHLLALPDACAAEIFAG